MDAMLVHSLVFIQLGVLLCSGSISTTQADITTPLPTVPTINPTTPTTTTPVFNPAVSNPDSPAAAATTTTNPLTTSPLSSSESWCVASQSASQTALQVALDYACSYGGADCSAIQPDGSCYSPCSLRDHASYAFNSYYQKNPLPNSCNFGGTGVITSTNPSYGTCQYPSTSMSSSVLNITNSSGATVFGGGPSNPTPTGSAATVPSPHLLISTCLVIILLAKNHLYI